jgi:BolA family transcriptional regulator, general stress-responsive regulator
LTATSNLHPPSLPRPSKKTHNSKLEAALAPTRLTIVDESSKHAGHAGNPGGGETHFRVEVVSPAFEGHPGLVARHRLVYAALGDDFKAGLHALAIKARTPAEDDAAEAARRAAGGGG